MALELTTRFSPITTGRGAKKQKTPKNAAASGTAHLKYITRQDAVAGAAWAGVPGETQKERELLIQTRMRVLADKGGELGCRIAEKGIVSLPNSWPPEAQQEAAQRIAQHLAPPGSEAMALVVIHKDKPNNAHLHFLAVDGAESHAAARARRPDAKRVRRANVIRLGDRGRPQELRREIAFIINSIAKEKNLDGVEWRSFKERNTGHQPTLHEGPSRMINERKDSYKISQTEENNRRLKKRSEIKNAIYEIFDSGGAPLNLEDFISNGKGKERLELEQESQELSRNLEIEAFQRRINNWTLEPKKERQPRSR